MLEIKLNVVNKREYEENNNYREVIIRLPKSEEELKKDFEYLGLDYNNLSIQDSHILDCEVIDSNNPHFSAKMSTELSNIINRARDSGWTTPYQDINNMYLILIFLNENQRNKFLAVLEFKKEQISNMADAVKYGNNLESFEFYSDVYTYEDYAEKLVWDGKIDISKMVNYMDMNRLGKDYSEREKAQFTNLGLILEKETKNSEVVIQQEDEEMEGE